MLLAPVAHQLHQVGLPFFQMHNLEGEWVRVLVSERKPGGYNKAVWDSRNKIGKAISSGVFFCKMGLDEFTVTGKMVMSKWNIYKNGGCLAQILHLGGE